MDELPQSGKSDREFCLQKIGCGGLGTAAFSVRRAYMDTPRLLLAGTNSGCGKTTVTCGILQALVNRGYRVGAFKCGPDYIDPMFHSKIIGARSGNLDPFFFPENTLRYLLQKNAADRDVSLIEGVMGYYDGMSMLETRGSSFHVAGITRSPAVLIVNARGAALSVLATIQGFLRFRPDSGIRGVILNGCSPMTAGALAPGIEKELGIRCYGCLPKMEGWTLESRHLGLVTADEVKNLREKMQQLAAAVEKNVDLDGLLALSRRAEPLCCTAESLPKLEPVRIAVARDRAFCFYYADSLDVLRELGAELVPFSPLTDPALPEGIQGLYLGGGYPELYTEALSGNTGMLASVRDAVRARLPCIAECGGFMYLTEAIGGQPMAGALPGTCFDTGKLTRFGYVTLTAKKDNLLCRAGESIPAHEFHHWDCTAPGADFRAEKPTGRSWDCAVATSTLYAGYPHFHFRANPAFAVNFCRACAAYRQG